MKLPRQYLFYLNCLGLSHGGSQGVLGVLNHPWPCLYLHCKGKNTGLSKNSRLRFSQTKSGKLAWFFVVCLGFIGAGYLINRAYSDWQDSPVSTSITTHPISNLDFPTVTVCPPKGPNTALSYDLMKADNNSFTDKDREKLKDELHQLFIETSHMAFINTMLTLVSPPNIEQVYKGFFTFPQPYEETGLEMIM